LGCSINQQQQFEIKGSLQEMIGENFNI